MKVAERWKWVLRTLSGQGLSCSLFSEAAAEPPGRPHSLPPLRQAIRSLRPELWLAVSWPVSGTGRILQGSVGNHATVQKATLSASSASLCSPEPTFTISPHTGKRTATCPTPGVRSRQWLYPVAEVWNKQSKTIIWLTENEALHWISLLISHSKTQPSLCETKPGSI